MWNGLGGFLNCPKPLISIREIIDFGLLLIAIAIILEVLFGPSSPFLGKNITQNLVGLINQLGSEGVVGIISVAIIIYLWNRLQK